MTTEPGKQESTASAPGTSAAATEIAGRIRRETKEIEEARKVILEMTKDWRRWQRETLFSGLFYYHSNDVVE